MYVFLLGRRSFPKPVGYCLQMEKVCRLRANDDTGLQSWFEVKKNMVFV